MDYKLLGKNIQNFRWNLSLTQAQLAEDVNLTTSYIGLIEQGKRKVTLDKLALIAERLGTSIDDLLKTTTTPTNQNDIILQNFLKSKSPEQKTLAYKVLKLILK